MVGYTRQQVDHWDREDEQADSLLSPQQRISLALQLFELARSTRLAGLKLEHPDATTTQLRAMFQQELDEERSLDPPDEHRRPRHS